MGVLKTLLFFGSGLRSVPFLPLNLNVPFIEYHIIFFVKFHCNYTVEATPKRQMVGNWQWNSYVQLQIDFIHANTECSFKEAILAIKLRRATNPDNGNYQAATAHKITTHKLAPWIYNFWEYLESHFVFIHSIIHFFMILVPRYFKFWALDIAEKWTALQ